MGLRSKLLEMPLVYDLLQNGLSRSESREWFVKQVIRPKTGQRILDIGCGTASVLNQLDGVRYTGIDHNPEYISKAREQFGDRGEFICTDICDMQLERTEQFDVVLMLRVLHHLPDDAVSEMIQMIPSILNGGGEMITLDCALADGQHPIAWLLAKLDRGRYARSPQRYRELLETHFELETEIVRHDLLKVPYTHAIFRATPKVS